MKKAVCGLFTLVILFTCTLTAFAESATSYRLDELGMTVKIPSNLITITRENLDSMGSTLSELGISADAMQAVMADDSMCLDAIDPNQGVEIIITKMESPLSDYSSYTDATLNGLAPYVAQEFEAAGIEYIRSEIYKNENVYLKYYISKNTDQGTDYMLEYNTVKNGKAINITLHSYNLALNAFHETTIQYIVDTAVFDAPEPSPSTSAKSAVASRYTDPDTNAYFTVPAGWTEQTPSIKENGVQMMFISAADPTKTIIYACQDLWEQMSESERSGYTRKDINISTFTEMDLVMIAMKLKISASDIQNVTYDFTKYYKIPEVFEAVGSATPFSEHSTALVTIQNGYMYQFIFTDTDASPAFADLEKLLESAYFPGANTVSSAGTIGGIPGGTAATPSPRSGSLTLSGLLGILVSLIVTIVVYSLPIFIYRFGIKKEPVPPKKGLLITLVYAVFAFIAMCVLLFLLNGSAAAGGALLLWSFVNYKMLTSGYVDPVAAAIYSNQRYYGFGDPAAAPAPTDPFPDGESKTCSQCGTVNPPNSRFCARCAHPFSPQDHPDEPQ